MKLTVLGGGGARIPALVRAVIGERATTFDRIDLFEPDADRRATLGRLSVEVATALGYPDTVRVTADIEEALTDTDYVFSAIRVGGDAGRVIDEQVAIERGLVGQETTGPGGAAMALRTIPVVLRYCSILARVAPNAVLVNFTNPAGIITQAITTHSDVKAVGVCDTPSSTLARLGAWLGATPGQLSFSYGGLNHLGWVSSVVVDGVERIDELLAHYEELRAFDHCFAAFDTAMVRRLGAIPTEYLYYFYDSAAYVAGVAHAGTSRGADVVRFNAELIAGMAKAWADGDVNEAWATYSRIMGARSASYMRLDVDGESTTVEAPATDSPPVDLLVAGGHGGHAAEAGGVGGYEAVALAVIDGLSGARPAGVIVNTRNGSSLGFLDPNDVVEVPSLIDARGVSPLAAGSLAAAPRGLVLQVKEYERAIVDAATSGNAETAALALALHPLVPGVSVARELMATYRERHGADLAYLR